MYDVQYLHGVQFASVALRTPGRPGRTRVFTEQQVLDVALGLVDSGGAAALTVRGVAAALGTAPNAVYTYFPTRDALRAALVEHVLAELDLDVPDQADWRDALRAVGTGLHHVLARHPGVVPLFVAGPMFGARALAAGEKILDLLARAGFPPDAAARALYTLLVYTIGFAAMDAAELPDGVVPDIADRVTQRRAAFEAVPADAYPRTRAAADTMAEYVTTSQFRAGLDVVLAGLSPAPDGRTA